MSFSTKLTTEVFNTLNKQSLAYKYKKDYDIQLKDSRSKLKRKYHRRIKRKNKKARIFRKHSSSKNKLISLRRKQKKRKKNFSRLFNFSTTSNTFIQKTKKQKKSVGTKDILNLKYILNEINLKMPYKKNSMNLSILKNSIKFYFDKKKKGLGLPQNHNIWRKNDLLIRSYKNNILLTKTIRKVRYIKKQKASIRARRRYNFFRRRYRVLREDCEKKKKMAFYVKEKKNKKEKISKNRKIKVKEKRS